MSTNPLKSHANQSFSFPPKAREDSRPAPFSLRLTPDERAYLEQCAGNKPLGTYIRQQLLLNEAKPRKSYRKPTLGDSKAAAALAGLGQSRLAANMNQIAKAANAGTIESNEELRQQLAQACQAIIALRKALFIALGLKCGDE